MLDFLNVIEFCHVGLDLGFDLCTTIVAFETFIEGIELYFAAHLRDCMGRKRACLQGFYAVVDADPHQICCPMRSKLVRQLFEEFSVLLVRSKTYDLGHKRERDWYDINRYHEII